MGLPIVAGLKAIGAGLVKPLVGMKNKKTDRKIAQDSIKGKLALVKEQGVQNVQLSESEWEQIGQTQMESSWKDEYVTVSIISVFNLIFVGAVAKAFGHPEILSGVVEGINTVNEVGGDFGFLLKITVGAALGIYVWRRV